MCWELKSTIKKIDKFYFFEEAIIREEKRVKVFIAPTNQGLENIYFEYERIDKEPEPIRVYGYPVIVDDKIKELAIKDIASFVPEDNEVVITDDNYDNYLTNSYLDTTKPEKDKFSIALCITLMLLLTVIVLFVSTMFLKDKPLRRKSIKERDHGV